MFAVLVLRWWLVQLDIFIFRMILFVVLCWWYAKPFSHCQIHVFDFQPVDPESINVALAALSGRPVAGRTTNLCWSMCVRPGRFPKTLNRCCSFISGSIFKRKLRRLPRERCWLVGSSRADALEAAFEFNKSWKTDLRIGHHDCRDYTNGIYFDNKILRLVLTLQLILSTATLQG